MFRKMALVAPTLLFAVLINAQFQKGDKMLGATIGSVFFNTGTTDLTSAIDVSTTSNDNFGLSFSPSYGWFTTDNLAIGIAPVISFSKQKILGKSSSGNTYLKDEITQYNFGLGGFARYYFEGSNKAMRVFGQYNLSLGFGGSKREGFEYERLGLYVDRFNQKSSGDLSIVTGPALGISKFLSNGNALDFYIGYNFSYIKSSPSGSFLRDYADPGTGDETQKIDYDQKFSGHNVMLAAGYQIFLGKKK